MPMTAALMPLDHLPNTPVPRCCRPGSVGPDVRVVCDDRDQSGDGPRADAGGDGVPLRNGGRRDAISRSTTRAAMTGNFKGRRLLTWRGAHVLPNALVADLGDIPFGFGASGPHQVAKNNVCLCDVRSFITRQNRTCGVPIVMATLLNARGAEEAGTNMPSPARRCLQTAFGRMHEAVTHAVHRRMGRRSTTGRRRGTRCRGAERPPVCSRARAAHPAGGATVMDLQTMVCGVSATAMSAGTTAIVCGSMTVSASSAG